MPLPFLLLGAAVGSVLAHDNQKSFLEEQDKARRCDFNATGREPSEILPSPMFTEMLPGAIVCCEVFEAFIHTGVVVDENTIVELHGSGLIRAISKKRFLEERSGSRIFIACNNDGTPYTFSRVISGASKDVFNFYDYDLLKANCYKHTWRWLTDEDIAIKSFSEFDNKLKVKLGQNIYWDVVK